MICSCLEHRSQFTSIFSLQNANVSCSCAIVELGRCEVTKGVDGRVVRHLHARGLSAFLCCFPLSHPLRYLYSSNATNTINQSC